MLKRLSTTGLLLAGVVSLASCGGSTVPVGSGSGVGSSAIGGSVPSALSAAKCYVGKGSPYTATAKVTFYGWPDNSPPGNAIAHPVIHKGAGGDGSYCNPTTFATEPTKSENQKIPYGTRIYVPYIQKYFIREDDCTKSGPQGLGCSGLWFDLWIGGDAKSRSSAVITCENNLTKSGKVPVVINPPNNEPVAWTGPIYNDIPPPNGSCNVQPSRAR